MSHMGNILRLQEALQALQREPMLCERSRVEILLSRCQVLLDALRNGRARNRIGLNLRHKGGAQRFCRLQRGRWGGVASTK